MATLTPAASKSTKKPRAAAIPRPLRQQAELILEGTYAYMDSPPFHLPDAEATLFADAEPALPMVAWYQPTRDDVAGATPAGTPQLMSAAEERQMFLRYNFCKVRLSRVQEQVKETGLTKDLANQAVEWHHKMEHFREYLTRTNLALVLAMAKRTRLGDIDFAEIVSEGNMALLRAVDKFNVDRGFKFSTYACRAILKAFSRTAQKHSGTACGSRSSSSRNRKRATGATRSATRFRKTSSTNSSRSSTATWPSFPTSSRP